MTTTFSLARISAYLAIVCTILIAGSFAGPVASAQIPGAKPAAKPEPTIKLPEPLTQQAIRDLISQLDDKQVRQLLISRLNAQAKARARARADKDNRALGAIINSYRIALANSVGETVRKARAIPVHISASIQTFHERRGEAPISTFFLALVMSLAVAIFAVWALRRRLTEPEQRILAARPQTLWSKLALVAARFALQITQIAAFLFAGYITCALLIEEASPDRYTVISLIQTISGIWLVIAVARFMLAPSRPSLRLCPIDDRTAGFIVWRAAVVAAVAGFGFGTLTWLIEFGMTFGASRFGFWVNLAIHVVIISTIWQARHGITAMLESGEYGDRPGLDRQRRWPNLADVWPLIAIGLVAAHWLIVEIIVATGNATPELLPVMMTTLAVLVCLPIIEHGLRALVINAAPVDGAATVPLQAAQRETQRGLVRCGRVLLSLALVFGLLWLWSVDVFSLAHQGVGARFASALIEISFVLLIGYAVWEFVTIISERQLAIERAAMGVDEAEETMSEGEGGQGETRLATIVPLVRLSARIAIATLVVFAVIGQLGVNITPLLAGAGIIGLAIGFGAQTLVKDIISGLFFLIDDAFRKGEYIDIGSAKGTVEKISVRSMQLRHHNGPLNTVPFGEIHVITNFSRDWVVMKLPLRLTYDTDAEAVRKMIKKLGQELMEDPVLGPQFLQPLKSQGVIQMEDSAMIMRVKFMTRPGDQWVIRRIVFARIRDLFEQKGVKFAHREVTVRLAEDERTVNLDERQLKAVTAAARATASE